LEPSLKGALMNRMGSILNLFRHDFGMYMYVDMYVCNYYYYTLLL